MALADYTPIVQWYADAVAAIERPSVTTKSNPGSLTDPTIAGITDQYADFGGTNGLNFLPGSPVLNVGTGDITIVMKARVDSFTTSDRLGGNYDGTGTAGSNHGLEIYIPSGVGRTIALMIPPRSESFRLESSSSTLVQGQDFIVAFRRSSGTWTIWLDVDASGGMTSDTPSTNAIGSSNISECGDIYFGCDRDGNNGFDGRIYWFVAFNTALSDADLQLSAWDTESNLKTAWLGLPSSLFTDFGLEADGALSNSDDWTLANLSGDWEITVITDAGATGGKEIESKDTAWGDALANIVNERSPTGGTTGNIEVVARVKLSSVVKGDFPIGPSLIDTTDGGDFYSVVYRTGADGTWRIIYFNGGVSWTGIGSDTGGLLVPANDTFFWIRLTRNGTTLKANVWSGAAEDEPAGFNITGGTDTTLDNVIGGISHKDASYEMYVDVWGFSTDGDKSAPTSSGGGLSMPIAAAYYRQMRNR